MIGSMLSIFGAHFGAAYRASKGGVVQLTRSLACAWTADNIQVDALPPGWADTDMGASAKDEVCGLEQRIRHRTPARRWGHGVDFAGIAISLASPPGDLITGTAVPVDGGYSVAR